MIRFICLTAFLLVTVACTATRTASPPPTSLRPSGPTSPAPPSPGVTAEPSAASTSPPTATPEPSASNFDEAVSFVTRDTTLLSFNDWAQIKESLGASDVTSQSPQDERERVLIEGLVRSDDRPASDLEYVVGGYGLQSAMIHAENWDFDVLDYDWDATITWDGPPISIVNLRDDLDMAPVLAHLEEREYASEQVNGATLWTHELDLSADWLTGELAILNVGILEDGRTLVMSSSDEAVRDFLASERGVPAPVQAAADALEGPSAAHLVIGAQQICDFVDPILAATDDQDIRDVIDEAGPLSAWDALGIGYSKLLDPIGRIAISYADTTAADHDLQGRRLLAEEGPSLIQPGSISDVQFTVDEASSVDGVVELRVTPNEGYARNMLQAVLTRDLAYATCGSQ